MANIGQGGSSLYKVLDAVERIKDSVESAAAERDAAITKKSAELEGQTREIGEQNAALKTEVETLRADRDAAKADSDDKIAEIEARCNKLDEMLPRGEKVFTTGVRSKDADLAAFGRAFTVARRAAAGDSLPADYARANLEGEKGITSNTVGGTLVPVETQSSAIRIIGEKSLARTIARQVPMGSDRMILPIQTGKPTVYWASEGAAASAESTVDFEDASKSDLIAKTLTAYDGISRELDEDSLVALEPFFAEVFGDSIAQEENKQLLVGKSAASGGTDPFDGIENGDWVNNNNTAAGYTVTYEQLVDTMYGVNGDSLNNGSWVMNSEMLGQVVGLVSSTGQPIFSSAWGMGGIGAAGGAIPNQTTGLAGFLLGRPLYTSNAMVASPLVGLDNCLAIYGNFDYAFFGDRRALSVEFDDSVFFRERKRCMLAYERVSVLIHSQENNKTFSKLTNAS